MRRLRLPAAAVAALAIAATPASSAAPRDQIRDAVGDARGDLKYVDIVSARWSSTGTGASKALVASMTLAEPPKAEQPFVYDLRSEVRGCGTVWFQYSPGNLANEANRLNNPMIADGDTTKSVWIECGDPGNGTTGSGLVYKQMTFSVKGNTITWSVPLTALPPELQVGAVFSQFSAAADAGEPMFGISLAGGFGHSLDHAVGDGIWRLR